MNIVNLTPHELNIYDENKNLVATILPSGTVARVSTTRRKVDTVNGIPLFETRYGNVEGLPGPKRDTIYVVSGLVRAAVSNRSDVYQPGELLRDEKGRPIGCIGLSR